MISSSPSSIVLSLTSPSSYCKSDKKGDKKKKIRSRKYRPYDYPQALPALPALPAFSFSSLPVLDFIDLTGDVQVIDLTGDVTQISYMPPYNTKKDTRKAKSYRKSENKDEERREEGIVECPICLESIKDVYFLPCMHKFCSICISTMCSVNSNIGAPNKCPLCKTIF